jgi:hypothetical protein
MATYKNENPDTDAIHFIVFLHVHTTIIIAGGTSPRVRDSKNVEQCDPTSASYPLPTPDYQPAKPHPNPKQNAKESETQSRASTRLPSD